MIVAEKVLEKEFEGKTKKEAYLNCCKWVSTNILAVNNSNHVLYRVEKVDVGLWSGKVRLTVYAMADENEIHERNCAICKEVMGSFFMAKNKYMCEVCNVPPYRKRILDKLKLIKEGLKGKIL